MTVTTDHDEAQPDAPAWTDGPAGTAAALAAPAAGVGFGLASLVRRARVFHPTGVAFSATLDVTDPLADGGIFGAAGRHRAVVRISKGLGTPGGLPDIVGVAVRVPDAYGSGADQDLLLVSAGGPPLLRHLLLPSRSLVAARLSSLLPYRAGERTVLFGGTIVDDAGSPRSLDELAPAATSGAYRIELQVCGPLEPWQRLATIELGRPLPGPQAEQLRFDPWNAGGGLRPAGFLNRVRKAAYLGSQVGRGLTGR